MIIKTLPGFEKKSIEGTREFIAAEIKELKSRQTKIKNVITKMQSKVEAIRTRMHHSETKWWRKREPHFIWLLDFRYVTTK